MKLPHVALGCVLLVAGACSKPDETAHKFRVAVIPKGTSHEFWKSVERGARRADDELSDLEIVWKGPAGEGDTAQQIALVENLLAGGVDALCLAPLDARALEAPVKSALALGKPVVIFDSGLADASIAVTSFVATDNRRGGEIAGEELARRLNGKGAVIVLRYQVGSQSTEQREEGCLAALARHADITLLSSDTHGGPDEAKAVEVAESLLATFGERVQGVFCSNESSVSGFLTALQRDPRHLAGKVVVVGFDSSAAIVKALESGALAATVLQDPVKMGYEAVKAAHAKLTGATPAARIPLEPVIATHDNMSEPAIHALLFPLG